MAGTIREKAISLPFSIDDFGAISTTISQSKIWADRVRSVIGTSLTERIMRYNFGTDIPNAIFETEEVTRETIQFEVAKAFGEFLPLLQLESTTTEYDEFTNTITATVVYALPNNDTGEVSVGIANISPDNPFSEVLR